MPDVIGKEYLEPGVTDFKDAFGWIDLPGEKNDGIGNREEDGEALGIGGPQEIAAAGWTMGFAADRAGNVSGIAPISAGGA